MRAIFGLLLVMLGLAMAVVWMPEHDGERQLAVVTDIATKGTSRHSSIRDRDAVGDADRNGRTFSPHTPLLASPTQTAPRDGTHTAGVARVVTPAGGTPMPAFVTTVTTATPPASSPAVTGAPGVASAPNPEQTRPVAVPDMPREELVRNLQRELKRVGCYQGDVDGDWGSGSRRAMGAFTDRVNASLPLDQPDFVLLTLLRGHSGAACGRDCPVGQTQSSSGRCMPIAVIAHQTRRVPDRRRAEEQPAEQVAALPSAATPLPSWETRVTRRQEPAVDHNKMTTAAAVAASAAAVAIAQSPLPGRMSVGAAPQPGSLAPSIPSPAQNAVRSANEIEALRRTVSAPRRAERPRRETRRAAAAGQRFARPVVVYRAPRMATPPQFYASAPRRTSSRSWTATFFGAAP